MNSNNKLPKTPSRCFGSDFSDMEMMSIPQPQASSTVQRKTFTGRYSHNNLFSKISNFDNIDPPGESTDSSLGLVNNISKILEDHEQSMEESNTMVVNKIEVERKLARQLLQRCDSENNEKKSLAFDTNKENDVNAQNLSMLRSNLPVEIPDVISRSSSGSITFKPNEFTARSSGMNENNNDPEEATSKYQSENNNGIFSFNSMTAEIMEKFADEDFISGSRISNQFNADELSCRQNFNSIPIANASERLEFSCFSGIIGEIDLSVESRTGRKISVGEYFRRKCGAVGHLSDTKTDDRPSFGLSGMKSPERTTKLQPLVNITTSTINNDTISYINDDTSQSTPVDESSIMSLSRIAQVLQAGDQTPRSLVDQLLMTKKKRESNATINCTSKTYTLQSANVTLPNINSPSQSSSSLFDNTKSNHKSSPKLLFDNKTLTDSINDIKLVENDFSYCNKKDCVNQIKMESLRSNTSVPPIDKEADMICSSLPFVSLTPEALTFTKNEPSTSNYDDIKQEQKSIISLSRFNEKISIGRNTQELYICVIGELRLVNIEIHNEDEHWFTCKLQLHKIQGNKSNVEINVPRNEILISPRNFKNAKILVKLLKDGDPVMASLAIDVTDMSSHETVTKYHMMCFVPQGLENTKLLSVNQPDACEIRIIDTEIPILLNKNKTKCVRIKNTSVDSVTLSASIVQCDDKRKFAVMLEPRKVTLRSGEVQDMYIQFQGTINDNNIHCTIETTEDDGKVLMNIKTLNNTYSYPIVIKMITTSVENRIDQLHCETPQHPTLSAWENISPLSPQSTSSTKSGRNSSRSAITRVTITGDTIPIKSTHSSLIWTSVRVRKRETREFTIRNTSNNKIKFQAVITDNNNSFKFLKDRDTSTTISVGLQYMESKTFTVIFSPNNIGAAAGRITFTHFNTKHENRESKSPKVILLFGYGGYAKVCISQALKIMGDQMWLSLGKLNLCGVLNSSMKLENSGDLSAYVKISLAPKTVYPSVETSWHIEPTELILGPKEVRWITIEFRPRKEDLVMLHSEVADMGTLTITHGDEPTRWRIRRLYKKLCESGQLKRRDEDDVFSNVVHPICKIFPNETSIPNLNIIRDMPQDLATLCRGVNRHVVTLVMELNADDTNPIFHDDFNDTNESQMFQSLRSDVTLTGASDDNSYMPSNSTSVAEYNLVRNMNRQTHEGEFMVSPTAVTLTPPSVNEATIMITSSSNMAQPFETILSHNEFLDVIPSEGMIPAKRDVILKIQCKRNERKNPISSSLKIFTSNEKREILIRIIPSKR